LVQDLKPQTTRLAECLHVFWGVGAGGRGEVVKSKVLEVEGLSGLLDMQEEAFVVGWAVGAEVLEDFCEGGFGHGDLEEVVHERDCNDLCQNLLELL
jgi:hypothetical protein